jgi:hypothetical protein
MVFSLWIPAGAAYAEGRAPLHPEAVEHGTGFVEPEADFFGVDDYDYSKKGGVSVQANLPSAFDYRDNNSKFLTDVRDQGIYGSCWAFAALASASGSLVKRKVKTQAFPLSPLQLVYAVYKNSSGGYYPDSGHTPLGSGGNNFRALAAMSRWHAPVDEKKYPYEGAERYDVGESKFSSAALTQSDYHLDEMIAYPTPMGENERLSQDNLDIVKTAIMETGPLFVAYKADTRPYEEYNEKSFAQ